MSRRQTLAARKLETRAIRTGKWGKWRKTDLPNGGPGLGWLREVRAAYANDLYAVLVRPVNLSNDRSVYHCAIRTISNLEPPWRDKQRIKDEIFGPEWTAVEVMPPKGEIVDGADMYHIWVFAEPLPFSLAFRDHRKGNIDA